MQRIYSVVALWGITFSNYFVMRYINKCTKRMQVSDIVANVSLRFYFVGFFGAAALLNSIE